MLFVVGVATAAGEPLLDQSVSFHQEMLTNSTTPLIVEQAEPEFMMGPNTHITGLIVDCAMPLETWDMLNPAVHSPPLEPQIPPSLMPLTPPPRAGDPAVHEANFALLRFSFR